MFSDIRAIVLLLSFSLGCYGRSICENGMYCVSHKDCPIGNHCKEFLVEKGKYLSRCVPRDDFDESHFCSLSFKSCEKIPCCSGNCDRNSLCRPFLPPNCTFPTDFSGIESAKEVYPQLSTKGNKEAFTLSSPTKTRKDQPTSPVPSMYPTCSPSQTPSSSSRTIFYSTCSNCCGQSAITTPITMTSIPDYAFDGCTSFVSVLIPTFVTSIGFQAFSLCTSLTSISIPSSVNTISVGAFAGCFSLTSISIPTSVNIISDAAFYSCTSLSSISIPTSVTYIGSYAFAGCTSLTCRRISDTTTVDSTAFQGDPANKC